MAMPLFGGDCKWQLKEGRPADAVIDPAKRNTHSH